MRLAFINPAPNAVSIDGDPQWFGAIDADLTILPQRSVASSDSVPSLSDGPLPSKMRSMCRNVGRALLFEYDEACSGEVFHAAQLVDSTGAAIANYRCTHPVQPAQGIGRWLTIVPRFNHRIGLLLGDDLLASEVWRALALSDVSIIVWIGGGHDDTEAILRTRALENGVAVAGVDRSAVHGFDSRGTALRSEAVGVTIQIAVGDPAAIGPPVKRQPILYRRLTADHESDQFSG